MAKIKTIVVEKAPALSITSYELLEAHKSWQDKLIDYSLYSGIIILALGLSASVADQFMPNALSCFGTNLDLFTTKLFPMLGPLASIAQTMWLAGCLALLVAPIYRRSWIFIVLEINTTLSCLLPILRLSTTSECAVRLSLTYLGIAALILLKQVPHSCLYKVISPLYWLQTLAGKHGPNQTCIVGTEFLGWGYALMATNKLVAYTLLFIGSTYLLRFAYLGMRQGMPLAKYWYVLNWIYVVALGFKIMPLVYVASSY